jgi:hypothetical protein
VGNGGGAGAAMTDRPAVVVYVARRATVQEVCRALGICGATFQKAKRDRRLVWNRRRGVVCYVPRRKP